MSYEWDQITSIAYTTLLELGISEFPIPNEKIKCKGVIIVSYQEYARKTGCCIDDINCNCELEDAFVIKGLRPGITLILYNEEVYSQRRRYTLWHEIGHVKCGHQKHGSQEEIEAHYFASQVLAPNALIHEIAKRGYSIDTSFLKECFGLSNQAAQKKSDYFSRYSFDHLNEYDELVKVQFSRFLDSRYPPISIHYDDDLYEELERKRKNWQ